MDYKFNVGQVRKLVQKVFAQECVDQQIYAALRKNNIPIEQLDEDQLLTLLADNPALQKIIQNVQKIQEQQVQFNQPSFQSSYSKNKLLVKLIKCSKMQDLFDTSVQFYLSFFSQTYFSPVKALTPLLNLNLFHQFNFPSIPYSHMLKLCAPLKLIIITINNKTQQRQLYGIKLIEWRFCLSNDVDVNVQIGRIGNQGDVRSGGIVHIRMKIMNQELDKYISDKLLKGQLTQQKKYKEADTLRFYNYSNQFYNSYKNIHSSFHSRLIKIFAQTQDNIYKPVCSFVYPIYNIRGIDSPQHAARFVSIIKFVKVDRLGKGSRWHRFQTVLAKRQADVQDHANMLASLLLGFGKESYVCIGTTNNRQHSWVLTQQKKGKKITNTFWQALSGQRFTIQNCPYLTVDTVYSYRKFYANTQFSNRVKQVSLNFLDKSSWKAMNETQMIAIQQLCTQMPIWKSMHNIIQIQKKIQFQLRMSLEQIIGRKWDQKLEAILRPALCNYQFQKLTRQTFGQESFQLTIKSYIPQNHTFKALPLQFKHSNTSKIMHEIRKSNLGREMLQMRGDSLYYGLRCKVIQFPCDYIVVWLILGVRYYRLKI